jgi:hypothetical protein
MRAATAALLLATLALAGCGSPAGGDPGGRRLHELAADPVFTATPAGARTVAVARTPARHAAGGFESGGWHGPSVVATIRGPARPADVFRFYGRRARAAGWRPLKRNALGLADTWTKTFPDGAAATLSLLRLAPRPGAPRPRYLLTGSIAPAAG